MDSLTSSLENLSPQLMKSGPEIDKKLKHLQLINAVSSNNVDAVLNAIRRIIQTDARKIEGGNQKSNGFDLGSTLSTPGFDSGSNSNLFSSGTGIATNIGTTTATTADQSVHISSSTHTPPTASSPQDLFSSYGTPLHLVVSLSPPSLIQNVISTFCSVNTITSPYLDWINFAKQPDRETPLHIAAKLARCEVIEMLFQVPRVDETIRDAMGRLPQECCSHNEQVIAVFTSKSLISFIPSKEYKNEFIGLVESCMRNALETGDHRNLDNLMEGNPRAKSFFQLGWIDINNSLDTAPERSFLHLAAKADNLELVMWALKYGADPSTKDKKGKRPADLARLEKIRDCLRHAKTGPNPGSASLFPSILMPGSTLLTSIQGSMQGLGPISSRDPPVLKGVLAKDGYQPRYFVLEAGVLSYYQDIKDYPAVCRGSISTLSSTTAFPDSNDLCRFDVSGPGIQKLSLKAKSETEAKKWVWAIGDSRLWLGDSTKLNGIHSRRGSRGSFIDGAGLLIPGGSSPIAVPGRLGGASPVPGARLGGSFDDFLGGSPSIVSGSHSRTPSASVVKKIEAVQTIESVLDAVTNDLQNPELRRLLILLKTETLVLSETIATVVDGLELSASHDLASLPLLLCDSGQHIESLVLGIVRYCIRREGMWAHKLETALENHKRLEAVLRQIVENPIDGHQSDHTQLQKQVSVEIPVSPIIVVPELISSSCIRQANDGFSDGETDDEFYDANEGLSASIATSPAVTHDDRPAFFHVPPDSESKEKSRFITISNLKAASEGYEPPFRTKLPLDLNKTPKPPLAIWSFLKNAIGKDLSKVTLPVLFNEPIGMLQRMSEDVEYIEVLALASRVGSHGHERTTAIDDDPARGHAERLHLDYSNLERARGQEARALRILLVGAFAMSNYSSTVNRTNKPFNPLLGETFELVDLKKQYRYLSEQVCHHPPISACHCSSPFFNFWSEVYVKSKFWGKSLELDPLGICHVTLPDYDDDGASENTLIEHYSWKKVTTCVNNLILGTLTIEHYGDLVVTNHRTGETCTITFKPNSTGGWFGVGSSKNDGGNQMSVLGGSVCDKSGKQWFKIQGKWDEYLHAVPVGTHTRNYSNLSLKGGVVPPLELWQVNEKQSGSDSNFSFSTFAMSLNQTCESLDKILPKSDSRRRKDQRAMERGEWTLADVSKDACEKQQRARRKKISALFDETGNVFGPRMRGVEFGEKFWSPRWFVRELEPDTGQFHWRFSESNSNGESSYWDTRKAVVEERLKWPAYCIALGLDDDDDDDLERKGE